MPDKVTNMIRQIGNMGLARMGSLGKLKIDTTGETWRPGEDDWEEIPVTLERFFEEFYPEPLYPEQQKLADAAFGTDPLEWSIEYKECLAFWGKGSGKDHTIAKLNVYAGYWVSCLKNPQRFFSLGGDTTIDIVNVCINARLAKDVYFNIFKGVIKKVINPRTGNNWFEDHGSLPMRDGTGGAVKGRMVELNKHIRFHSLDSEKYTGEGLNILIANFDEVGGFDPKNAQELYEALQQTQASRFPRGGFKTMMFSFKRSDNDFMNIRYVKSKKEKGVYRSKKATWQVNLNVRRNDPEIIAQFLKNPEKARLTYQCAGEVQEGAYFKYKKALRGSYNKQRDNPLKSKVARIIDVEKLAFEPWFQGDGNTEHYVHIDLAKGKEGGDCAGFSMVHVQPMEVKIHKELIKNSTFNYLNAVGLRAPGIFVDLAIQIKAPPGGEVVFEGFHYLVKYLMRNRKFNISWVTYDGWQSVGEIQRFEASGMDSEVLSVDRKPDAYDCLKGLIYSGRIDYYYQPILIRELEELIITEKGKIDHPDTSLKRSVEEGNEKGSKDMADAIAGAGYKAVLETGGMGAWFDNPYEEVDYNNRPLTEDLHPKKMKEAANKRYNERMKALSKLRNDQTGGKNNRFIS